VARFDAGRRRTNGEPKISMRRLKRACDGFDPGLLSPFEGMVRIHLLAQVEALENPAIFWRDQQRAVVPPTSSRRWRWPGSAASRQVGFHRRKRTPGHGAKMRPLPGGPLGRYTPRAGVHEFVWQRYFVEMVEQKEYLQNKIEIRFARKLFRLFNNHLFWRWCILLA